MAKGNKITEEKKDMAVALLRAGSSYREIADVLNISTGSVHNIAKEPPEEVGPLIAELKKRLAGKHYLLANCILSYIEPMGIVRSSLKDKVLAAAILIDKARLIEGEGYLKQKKEVIMAPKENITPEARKEEDMPEEARKEEDMPEEARREDMPRPEQDVNTETNPENLK